jgi:hypothetical protein
MKPHSSNDGMIHRKNKMGFYFYKKGFFVSSMEKGGLHHQGFEPLRW